MKAANVENKHGMSWLIGVRK